MTRIDEIDYLEDAAGPGVVELDEAPAAPPGAELEAAQPTIYPGWEQETIEQLLRGTGAGLHMLAGRAEKDWLMTDADLQRIAPPLTRICNRYEATLRLSPVADPLLVAHGMALYGWRSALEAKRAQRDAEAQEPAGPGYEHGPAPQEGPLEEELEDLSAEPYFQNGDSHA